MDLAYDFVPKGQAKENNFNKNLNKNNIEETKGKLMGENNNNNINNEGNEIDFLTNQVKVINSNKKIVKREVEIKTKITYTYEDGSTKEINEVKKHCFDY